MKTAWIKTLLLCAPLILTSCSLTMDSDNAAQKRPVIIENANESIPQPPNQVPANAPKAEPHDQNTLQSVPLGAAPTNNEPVGGSLEKSMDSDDKIKMSRALDKAPGKTTSWTNNHNGMHYAVTPIRKIVLKDNPFCRVYQMVATRGSHAKEISGTACISEDGNWHPM
jgi:surface antigen